jgi:hypothetical protein
VIGVKTSRAVVWLASLVAALALVASSAGLFWQGEGELYSFVTLRGETVEIYGRGLYRHDTFLKAHILRGTDAVTLFAGVPLLLVATMLYRRGSLQGGLLLVGLLSYFLYNAALLALGTAYNDLALVYIAYLSASFFAFVLAFRSIDLDVLAARVSPRLPHHFIAVFLFMAGSVAFVWLTIIVGALLEGATPDGLASYTTEPTFVFDLAITGPTAFLAGALVLRRAPLGYLLAATLLVLYAFVGLMVVGQTVATELAGITLGVGQFVAFVASFVVMSLFAIWLLISFFRSLEEPALSQELTGELGLEGQ